jgi:hypothetical protein
MYYKDLRFQKFPNKSELTILVKQVKELTMQYDDYWNLTEEEQDLSDICPHELYSNLWDFEREYEYKKEEYERQFDIQYTDKEDHPNNRIVFNSHHNDSYMRYKRTVKYRYSRSKVEQLYNVDRLRNYVSWRRKKVPRDKKILKNLPKRFVDEMMDY